SLEIFLQHHPIHVANAHGCSPSLVPSRRSLILGKGGIGIAIKPALARLRGRDDWMPARPRVFAGVLIRRAVATQRHATLLAGAQMHPFRPDRHTLRALAMVRKFDGRDGGK